MSRLTKEREEQIRSAFKFSPDLIENELLREIDALREDINSRGIHTCHDHCRNPMCLLTKENAELQTRVKDLEAEHAIWEKHGLSETVKENARLRKVLERISKLTDSRGDLEFGAKVARQALRELDGDKK